MEFLYPFAAVAVLLAAAGAAYLIVRMSLPKETAEQRKAAEEALELRRLELNLRALEFKAHKEGLNAQESAAYAAMIQRRNRMVPPIRVEQPVKRKYRTA